MLAPVSIPPGVVRGSTPAQSRGRYWDANLVRWRSGVLQPVGGWERMTATPMTGAPRSLLWWRDLTDIRRLAIGADDGLFVLEGDTITNRSPAGFVPPGSYNPASGGFGIGAFGSGTFGSPRPGGGARIFGRPTIYSLDNFGQTLLSMASSDGRLLELVPSGGALPATATAVSAAPISNRAMLVTEERHVMIFGAAGVPYRVAWSDRENYNDWNFASTTNAAGFFDLPISGWIVNAVRVRGGILIWTDSDAWFARYVGQPFIYSFERIGEACGLYSPTSFASSLGFAVWMGRENFFAFDNGVIRPLACDVGDFVFSGIDPVYGVARSFGMANGVFPEFWFHYPSEGSVENDRYVCVSLEERWWSIGALPRTTGVASGVYPYPVAAGADRHLYQHETGWTDAGLARTGQVYAETGAIDVPRGGATTVDVLGAQMDSGAGYASTQARAYSRFTADGPEYAEGPFAARDDGWMDMRFSARDFRLRIEATQDRDWSIGEMRLDLAKGGQR